MNNVVSLDGNVNNSSISSVEIFKNSEFGSVRTVVIDGEPWLAGNDVASILGYKYPANAIQDHVDKEDKKKVQLSDLQDMDRTPLPDHMRGSKIIIINESGFYSLVLRSELESAKRFKKWITGEVLPAIRKMGYYSMNGVSNPTEAGDFEDYIKGSVAWVEGVSRIMRLNDVSRLDLLKQIGSKTGLPTPNYVKAHAASSSVP